MVFLGAATLVFMPSVAGAVSITGVSVTSSSTSPEISVVAKAVGPSFRTNLQMGATSPDVLRLQQYLNTHGCQIANSGIGSYGNETTYFGAKTKAALICFQTDAGIKPATGYFGPITRAYISTLP